MNSNATATPGETVSKGQAISVIQQQLVTGDNLGEILGLTPPEQHALIDLDDVVSVYFFHNRLTDRSGTVTIWHNKLRAALKTPILSLSGEWLANRQLIVTEEMDEAWTSHGELITGRLAFDINGRDGIYSCGEFYPRLTSYAALQTQPYTYPLQEKLP